MSTRREKIETALEDVGIARANGDTERTISLVRFLLENKVPFVTIAAMIGLWQIYP